VLGAVIVVAGVSFRGLGVAPVLVGFFVAVSSLGAVWPTTTTLSLANHGAVAGSASALLGIVQYAFGALAAPLVGVAGAHSAVPMAALMLTFSVAAVGSLLSTRLR
jgi:DHA1 family bicyclomycin/chloramphenicol resistance-like MFS transporter